MRYGYLFTIVNRLCGNMFIIKQHGQIMLNDLQNAKNTIHGCVK